MDKPGRSQPKSTGERQDPLDRLDSDLTAFQAGRKTARNGSSSDGGASAGYMLLGQMLGGVLGGLGLGWLVDRLAHTAPWGVVIGLACGMAASIYSTIRAVSRASVKTTTKPGPDAPDTGEDR